MHTYTYRPQLRNAISVQLSVFRCYLTFHSSDFQHLLHPLTPSYRPLKTPLLSHLPLPLSHLRQFAVPDPISFLLPLEPCSEVGLILMRLLVHVD